MSMDHLEALLTRKIPIPEALFASAAAQLEVESVESLICFYCNNACRNTDLQCEMCMISIHRGCVDAALSELCNGGMTADCLCPNCYQSSQSSETMAARRPVERLNDALSSNSRQKRAVRLELNSDANEATILLVSNILAGNPPVGMSVAEQIAQLTAALKRR